MPSKTILSTCSQPEGIIDSQPTEEPHFVPTMMVRCFDYHVWVGSPYKACRPRSVIVSQICHISTTRFIAIKPYSGIIRCRRSAELEQLEEKEQQE